MDAAAVVDVCSKISLSLLMTMMMAFAVVTPVLLLLVMAMVLLLLLTAAVIANQWHCNAGANITTSVIC